MAVDRLLGAERAAGAYNLKAKNSSFHDALVALECTRSVKLDGCTFVDNGIAMRGAIRVAARGVTITGSTLGVFAVSASFVDSTVDTSAAGPDARDFRTSRRPRLKNSTCAGGSENRITGDSWGICALD